MQRPTYIIGWARAYPKSPADAQRRALEHYGIPSDLIVVDGRQTKGRSAENWPWLLKKLRAGDALAVTKLRAIYDADAGRTPRLALFRSIHNIEDMGCVILEISTDRSTAKARERDMMIADCLDDLARSRSGGDAGRPASEWSKAELAIVEKHWRSLEHATNALALKAIKAEAKASKLSRLARLSSPQLCAHYFGPSGRALVRRSKK